MTAYTLTLFLHIVGALGIFVALGLEWTALTRLRRAATADQVREWLQLPPLLRRIGPPALGLILLTGIYMTFTSWRGDAGWVAVALGAMVLFLPALGALNGIRFGAIARGVAGASGPLSSDVTRRLQDPILVLSLRMRAAVLLGIVLLMATKPSAAGALSVIGAAAVIGLASALPAWGRAGKHREAA
jgi:hypothetical protein